jgi:GNAT superfamily N-acetyltransferase
MPEITTRPVQDQEMLDILYWLDNYSFHATPPFPDREDWSQRILSRVGASYYALFEDDAPVAITCCPSLVQNVRGKIFRMGGFADVSTHPKARRKGYSRQLIRYALRELRDQGNVFSSLYPFRESFYERLGFITFPLSRKAIFKPPVLASFLNRYLPGEVDQVLSGDGYETYRHYIEQMMPAVHGMAMFVDSQKASAQGNRSWLILARHNDETIGLMMYNLQGEEMMKLNLRAFRFYYKNSLGKYLLLNWIARHIDQAERTEVWLPAYEQPNTWLPDLQIQLEPVFVAAMGRILDITHINGMECGEGKIDVRISDPDCPWNEATWRLEGIDGVLKISTSRSADCHLAIQGLSALVYGTNDPQDFEFRGWGNPNDQEQAVLRKLFPLRSPYLHEYY